jgi:hypothetical protein
LAEAARFADPGEIFVVEFIQRAPQEGLASPMAFAAVNPKGMISGTFDCVELASYRSLSSLRKAEFSG